jgi:hypothetical protein
MLFVLRAILMFVNISAMFCFVSEICKYNPSLFRGIFFLVLLILYSADIVQFAFGEFVYLVILL